MSLLLRGVEVEGAVVDVRLQDGRVSELGSLVAGAGEQVMEGAGGALLPGLHDHHVHLLATAAALGSVDVHDGLEPLRSAPGTGWVRAVGWSGEGDRLTLDAVTADRPVRVQHRSGALWVVNSAGVRALGLAESDHPGVERDEHGEPTGRLWRADDLVAARLGRETPDLAALGARLAALGVTGVTDATPDLDPGTCALLRSAVPQRLQLLGDREGTGPWKVVLADHELPGLEELVDCIRAARPRPVAVHCVTREALVLLLAALDDVGRHPGDRVEHGSVVPLEVVDRLPAVVTQPGFVLARGDDYLRDVDARDLPDLYRYRSLLAAGCSAVPSSDAPYGPLDPWAVLRAARDRRSARGEPVNSPEAVDVATALSGMLRPLEDLTAPPRRVVPGAPADLVLLGSPLAAVLTDPDADAVVATWVGGTRLR
jgi:predicted amidohydrolase YtcJ